LCALPHVAGADCGGLDQRACCLGEASFGACMAGLTEVAGCSGDCRCGNSIFNAISSCRLITACGDDGQRACCNGACEFSKNGTACNDGLTQAKGCSGDCWCGGCGPPLGEQSIGTCVPITPCGWEGQRACCNGLGEYSNDGLACDSGLVQIPGCDE